MHFFRTTGLVLLAVGATSSCATEHAVTRTAHPASVALDETPASTPTGQAAVATSAPARSTEPVPTPASFTGLTANLTSPQVDMRRPPGVEHQHFMVLLGQRNLEDSVWENLDEQFSVGFTFDKQVQDAPVSLDVGLHFSDDSTTTVTGVIPVVTDIRTDVLEFDLGAMKMFGGDGPGLKPYLGAGVALSWVSGRVFRFGYVDDTDFTPGYYGRGGVALQLKGGALFGVDFRYLGGTRVNLAGLNADIDGWVGSISLGYGF